MTNPELSLLHEAPINEVGAQKFISTVRELLPATEPMVVDLSEFIEDAEPVMIMRTAAHYEVDGWSIAISENDDDFLHEVEVEIQRDAVAAGVPVQKRKFFTVNVDDLTPGYWETDQQTDKSFDSEEFFQEYSIRRQVAQITGDDIFTQSRLQEVLLLLSQCTPDTSVSPVS